jgi:signal transduction histidine kinase
VKISHRLYIAIAPAVIGVLAVAGLTYWGRYARQVPELVVTLAIVAAVLSFVAAWSNARFLARRIERLAGTSAQARARALGAIEGSDRTARPAADASATPTSGALRGVVGAVVPDHVPVARDEIDEIQRAVERLSHAVDVAESDRASTERREDQRMRDHAQLLLSIVDGATRRVDEIRLPLHILLDNHFGDLNENQEEMLGAARAAAEAIDTELVSLRRFAELDLGTSRRHAERIRPSDLVQAVVPLLAAAAESAGVSLRTDIAPLLPPVVVDRAQLQEAVTTLFRGTIVAAKSGAELELRVGADTTDGAADGVEILLTGGRPPAPTIHTALATRLVSANGGVVEPQPNALRVVLPVRGVATAQPSSGA